MLAEMTSVWPSRWNGVVRAVGRVGDQNDELVVARPAHHVATGREV
jgi:hypothetical protein